MATEAITARRIKNDSIRILSDSMSVLPALGSYDINAELIFECNRELTESCNHVYNGHDGSRINDGADELPRNGSKLRRCRARAHSAPPLPIVKTTLHKDKKNSIILNTLSL